MTVKEIAQAVGKDVRSVQRWIKTVSDRMSSVSDKMTASSPMRRIVWRKELAGPRGYTSMTAGKDRRFKGYYLKSYPLHGLI